MNDHALPETLLGLLRLYSPSGQEGEAVEYLVARMRTLGFAQAFIDPAGNAVGIVGTGQRQIVLLGHIDTVAGQIPVRVEGGKLYGRGAVDAKGPLAAFVDAVAGSEPGPEWCYVVIGAVDEERDSSGARYILPHYHPDYAIIGEPSRWDRITLGYKGSARSEITVHHPLAHTAGEQESPSEMAFQIWDRLSTWVAEYNADKQRAFDKIVPALQGIASGDDGFEGWASLKVGVRLPLSFSPSAWYQRLSDLADAAEVKPLGFALPAYLGSKSTPLVRAFLASVRANGGQPGFVLKTGTTDMNLVAPFWGCPAVAYGPGDSTLDHTPNEHILLGEYTQALSVLRSVLAKLCA